MDSDEVYILEFARFCEPGSWDNVNLFVFDGFDSIGYYQCNFISHFESEMAWSCNDADFCRGVRIVGPIDSGLPLLAGIDDWWEFGVEMICVVRNAVESVLFRIVEERGVEF